MSIIYRAKLWTKLGSMDEEFYFLSSPTKEDIISALKVNCSIVGESCRLFYTEMIKGVDEMDRELPLHFSMSQAESGWPIPHDCYLRVAKIDMIDNIEGQ